MATSKTYKNYTIVAVSLSIYAVLIISLVVWLFIYQSTDSITDKLGSPPVIILAIVVSVLTFTISSAVFAAIGKSNENRALGMPDGSIRALIALSLITLFFILATQIYTKISEDSAGNIDRVSEADLKELSIKDIISKRKVDSLLNKDTSSSAPKYQYIYNVTIRVPANSDAGDMAKTIIASFTALIAAICGFYFGSAASKQSTDTNPKPDAPKVPKITPKSPVPTTAKEGQPIIFEWNVDPPGQSLKMEATPDTNQPVADPSNPMKFTYTPGITGNVKLKVSLSGNPSVFLEFQINVS